MNSDIVSEQKELKKDLILVMEYLTKGPGSKLVKFSIQDLAERILQKLNDPNIKY